jgi:hypothetical protein
MDKITIELNAEEQAALLNLCDASLRLNGMAALDLANHFRGKIGMAQQLAKLSGSLYKNEERPAEAKPNKGAKLNGSKKPAEAAKSAPAN